MNYLQTLDSQELHAIDGGLAPTGSFSDLLYLIANAGKILV